MPLPVRRSNRGPGTRSQGWEPYNELERLHEDMGRLMQSVWAPAGDGDAVPWVPVADVEETEDAWIIEAEVPGVDRNDINVELHDSELVISGELKQREHKGVLRRQTRRIGNFEYRVVLPGEPDEENIEANLHDGILTVTIPKGQMAKPHRIKVKAT